MAVYRINFTVCGRDLSALEELANKELENLVPVHLQPVNFDMDVKEKAGTHGDPPNVALWTGEVTAIVKV